MCVCVWMMSHRPWRMEALREVKGVEVRVLSDAGGAVWDELEVWIYIKMTMPLFKILAWLFFKLANPQTLKP